MWSFDEVDLDGFRAALANRGLAEGTIDTYLRDAATALEGPGFLARLKDEAIAPKTKRHILATARHWARYRKDKKLRDQLDELRLPPARRKRAKVPIERDHLFALLDQIQQARDIPPATRAVIGLMATRGLRIGDVLRLTREEVERALAEGTLAFEAKGRRRLEFRVLRAFKPWLLDLQQLGAGVAWARVQDLVAPRAVRAPRAAAHRAVERALVRLTVRSGIFNAYPHRLRRTYAVEFLRQLQGDPEALIKLTQHMQWASTATALEYVDHQRGEELDEVADRMFLRDAPVR